MNQSFYKRVNKTQRNIQLSGQITLARGLIVVKLFKKFQCADGLFVHNSVGEYETFAKRPFLPNPPKADKFLRLPREMRSLFLWGQAQILILKILNVFLWLKFSPSLNLNKNEHFSKASVFVEYWRVLNEVILGFGKNPCLSTKLRSANYIRIYQINLCNHFGYQELVLGPSARLLIVQLLNKY
jgi:hypothetical protein